MDIKDTEDRNEVTIETIPEEKPEEKPSLGWKGLVILPIVIYLLLSVFAALIVVTSLFDGASQAMTLLLWAMIIVYIIMFFLCRYLIGCNEVIRLRWRSAGKTAGNPLLLVILYSLALIVFEFGLSEYITSYTDVGDANEMIAQYFQFGNAVTAVVLVVVVTPLTEEMMFRGAVFGGLRERYGFWPAALISSAIFAAAHMNPWSMVCTFMIAMFYALLFEKTGSLVYSMIGHGINNLIAVLCLILPGFSLPSALGPLLSLAAIVLMLAIYRRMYRTKTGRELDIQVYKEDLSYIDETYQHIEIGNDKAAEEREL